MKKSRLQVIPQTEQFGYEVGNVETSGEKGLLEKILCPNAVLFDVGAEKGAFTRAALEIEPHIHAYAFEPDADLYSQLKSDLSVFPSALAYPGLSTLDQFCRANGISGIHFLRLSAKNISLLDGATDLLRQKNIPNIQFTYNKSFSEKGICLKDVMQKLSDQNYVLFRIFSHGLIHMSEWKDWLENLLECNYFAILRSNISQCEPMTF